MQEFGDSSGPRLPGKEMTRLLFFFFNIRVIHLQAKVCGIFPEEMGKAFSLTSKPKTIVVELSSHLLETLILKHFQRFPLLQFYIQLWTQLFEGEG